MGELLLWYTTDIMHRFAIKTVCDVLTSQAVATRTLIGRKNNHFERADNRGSLFRIAFVIVILIGRIAF